jgi:hypothetical protein
MSSKEPEQSAERDNIKQPAAQFASEELDFQVEKQPQMPVVVQQAGVNTHTLTPMNMLRLQRMVGNQAVSRMLKNPGIQRQNDPKVAVTPMNGPSATVQRFIKGKGASKGVVRLLEENAAWSEFIDSSSRKSIKYKEHLDALLEHLHSEWEYGFEPDVIAEKILANSFDEKGLARAKAAIVAEIEEHIDEEVLSSGHSGEKHYGKDAKYQQERMESEGKGRVTTLEDSKRTRTFFNSVAQTVSGNLFGQLHDLISSVAETLVSPPTVKDIKAITTGFLADVTNKVQTFDTYKITLETISVAGGPGNSVAVTIRPKLESLEDYPKTEYTRTESEVTESPIVMYWGSKSPVISVTNTDTYDTLFEKLTTATEVHPVTAF